MDDLSRRNALKLAAGAGLLGHATMSGAAEQEKGGTDALRVIFGTHGQFVGDDWYMEVNCRHPSDVNQACDPNCSAIIPRHCIRGLRLLFRRCRELPGRPRIWRVVLQENCRNIVTLAPGQARPQDAPFFIEQDQGGPDEGVDISLAPRR